MPDVPLQEERCLAPETLRTLSYLHGCTGETIDKLIAGGGAPPVRRDGIVAAVEDTAADSAALYAQLSGRAFAGVLSLHALRSRSDVAVVLTSTDSLTAELLLWVHSLSLVRGYAPGLIIGRNQAALMRNALKAAIALSAKQTRPLGAAYLNPYAPFEMERLDGLVMLGAGAEAEDVRTLTSAGHPILGIETHADIGANAWLHPDLLLCPIRSIAPDATSPLRPMCLDTGRCYRFSDYPSRQQAWADDRLIPASALAAQVLVLFGCALLRPADGIMAPGFSVGAAVADDAAFGVALLTWCDAVAAADGASIKALMHDLAQGTTAGKALARFHNSDVALAHGSYLCLLGDPDFRLPVPFPCDTGKPTPPSERFRPLPTLPAASPQFIDHVLLAPASVADLAERQRRLRAARDTGGSIDEPIAELLAVYPWLNKYQISELHLQIATEAENCPQCRRPARTYDMLYAPQTAILRSHLSCERCGAAWNRAHDSRSVASYLGNRSFQITNVVKHTTVQIVIEARDTRFRSIERFHLEETSRNAIVRLDSPGPSGPGFAHVHLISSAGIDHFVFRSRSSDGLDISIGAPV